MAANITARRKRLLVLADHLENAVKPMLNGCKFAMAQWASVPDSNTFTGFRSLSEDELPRSLEKAKECGFAGCAVGWGLTHRTLRPLLLETAAPGILGLLTFDYDKLGEVFGISQQEAMSAFLPSKYDSMNPRLTMVAARLRKLAAQTPADKEQP